MKYRNIILIGFFAGSLLSLTVLLFYKAQQPQPIPPHRGNDMEGVAYALAVGFNIVLAVCSLPVLFLKKDSWRVGALLLLALPMAFTLYAVIALDAYALMYCLPYLLVVTVLFFGRIRKYKLMDNQ